jgi:hypothetical protein
VAGSRRRARCRRYPADAADAVAFAPPIEELAALARRPGWIAEEPGIHLVPHLDGGGDSGLRVLHCGTGDDGALEVAAEHSPGDSRRDIRRRAWTLIGTIAEPAASVRERRDGETVVFEVVTGVRDGSGQFAGHGHALRIRVRPPTVP